MKMKSISTLLLILLASVTLKAQQFSTATDALLYFEDNAKEIFSLSRVNRAKLNAARLNINNGNFTAASNRINNVLDALERIEELSDELNTGSFQAAQLDPNASDPVLLSAGVTIEGILDGATNNLVDALGFLNNGQPAAAVNAVNQARAILTQVIGITTQAIAVSRSVRNSL